jgi:hypothetical protein
MLERHGAQRWRQKGADGIVFVPDGSKCKAWQEPRRPVPACEKQGSGGLRHPAVFDQRHAHHALIASLTQQFISISLGAMRGCSTLKRVGDDIAIHALLSSVGTSRCRSAIACHVDPINLMDS